MSDACAQLDLTGRHALVCGASKGIGRATALLLAARGAKVTALARSAGALKALVSEITAAGGRADALVADLDSHTALEAAIEGLIATARVHILVNNTGGPPGGPLLQAKPAAIEHALSRHLLSAHLLVTRCLPGMEAAVQQLQKGRHARFEVSEFQAVELAQYERTSNALGDEFTVRQTSSHDKSLFLTMAVNGTKCPVPRG